MKNVNAILLAISLVLNLIYFIKLKTTNSKLDDCNYSLGTNTELLTKIANNYIIHYDYEGRKIDAENSEMDMLLPLVKKGPKLFLSFNQNSCEGCVNHALSELNEIRKNIGNNNIIIITNYENINDAKYLEERFNNDIKVINFESTNICLLNDERYPYLPPNYFILDSSLTVNLFYVYSLEYPTLNVRYFKAIEKYFNHYSQLIAKN